MYPIKFSFSFFSFNLLLFYWILLRWKIFNLFSDNSSFKLFKVHVSCFVTIMTILCTTEVIFHSQNEQKKECFASKEKKNPDSYSPSDMTISIKQNILLLLWNFFPLYFNDKRLHCLSNLLKECLSPKHSIYHEHDGKKKIRVDGKVKRVWWYFLITSR